MSKQAVPESRKKRLLSQVGTEASLPEPSGLRTGAWEAPYLYFCHCFWHRKYSTCASRQAIGHPSSGPIPPGTTSSADEASIKVYFERHPPELLIGYEFVDEMNPLILFLLQDSPRASYQRLSLHQSGRRMWRMRDSDPPCKRCRARIFNRLKSGNLSQVLEHSLLIIQGLCATPELWRLY
ncbi:hypothetical protein PABG_11785 [Paracoccidioides brasiliensis Pb03]|nr:hypothetical protein PABG_11785 [Paracoccidioides brasiliensis Pb03]